MRLLTYKATTDGFVLRLDDASDVGNDTLLCKQLHSDGKLVDDVLYTHSRIKEFIVWDSEDNLEGITENGYTFTNDRPCYLRTGVKGIKEDITDKVKSMPVVSFNAETVKPDIKALIGKEVYYYHPLSMELYELVIDVPMTPYIGEHGKKLVEGRKKKVLRSVWSGKDYDFTPLLDFSWFYVIPKKFLQPGYTFDIDGQAHTVKSLTPAKLMLLTDNINKEKTLKPVVVLFNDLEIMPFADFYYSIDGVEKETSWRRSGTK